MKLLKLIFSITAILLIIGSLYLAITSLDYFGLSTSQKIDNIFKSMFLLGLSNITLYFRLRLVKSKSQ